MKYPLLKEGLTRVGSWVSPKWIHFGNGVLNYLNLGRWFRDRHLSIPIRCADREHLAQTVAAQAQEPASYLEFGVYSGTTLGYWTKLLKHPDSFLHGFDSFEGLPEDWGPVGKDTFKLDAMPRFEDPRVRLFKGWFSDTLPAYVREFKPNPTLVIHLDADLYSSTILVLRQLRPFMRVGTLLIFDEFFDREHELKAFDEFLKEHPFGFECVGATRSLCQAAFRLTAMPPEPRQPVQKSVAASI